jgi:acetyl-CoA synthetase
MRGLSFSHVLTAGNSADVDVADEVAYLAEDPGCAAIACVFEGMPDPTRLFEAADLAWAANKPLVIFKLAVGEQGAAAALSHTGSLAGSRAAYSAAFRRHGIIEVDSFEALTETASFFAKASPPKADGVAVIATSGGAAILAADVAEKYGVSLPQPSAAVTAILSAEIPEFGSARNPCDVTAQVLSNPESLARCAGSLLGDPAFGTLLCPTVYANETVAARQAVFDRLAAAAGKPIGVVWLTQWYEGPGAALAEQHPNLVLFHSMDRAFATLAAWHRQARLRSARAAGIAAPFAVDPALRSDTAAQLAEAVRLAPPSADVVLTEREAKAVLAGYGVPVVADRLARSRDEAVAAATALGHPVVMKIESPDIAHKTEAGGVMLALGDDAAVAAAYDRILINAASHDPTARLTGVLVQPMAPAGVEMLIGARVDPQFGPLIVVGMGGVLVELLHDSALALAPVAVDEARSMIDSLRAARLLDGFRGARPIDRGVLAELVARVSTFVADHRDLVVELDLNPVICHPDGIVAVDALIRLAAARIGAD